MTTGSLCLTEILMSRKSCSSNSEHSHSADSTSASGGGLAVLGQQPLVQRAGVDADPDRRRRRRRRARAISPTLSSNCLDVARVDPDRGAAGVDRGEHVLRLEVDVGDDRDLRLAWRSPAARRRRPGDGHRDPDDLAAGRGQLGDLLQRRVDVGGQGGGHRLHARPARRRRPAPTADHDLAGLPARARAAAGGTAGMPRSDTRSLRGSSPHR